MGRKRKLRKKLHKRGIEDQPALVICVGKRCCPRAESRALVEKAAAYVEKGHLHVPVVTVGCLDVCKKGPIAATYPKIKVRKHVTFKRARKLLEKLERRTS
ncbi:MAG: (2Fe-2S) ferredoxin domain-containing protein [Kofleriaceae bacterium]|nr:(2Fe-2S) ferredoxin domain-containing protein [Kofleriaceae bacterium]